MHNIEMSRRVQASGLPSLPLSATRWLSFCEGVEMAEKRCSMCRAHFPLSEFYSDSSKPDGLGHRCRPCEAERSKHRREDPGQRRKWLAKDKVMGRVRRGTMTRLPCAVCGSEKVEGHHPDYGQPLVVTWLCRLHHTKEHKALRATL